MFKYESDFERGMLRFVFFLDGEVIYILTHLEALAVGSSSTAGLAAVR